MADRKEKPKRKRMKQGPAMSHEDEPLPPARAAAQVAREAEFRRLVDGPLINRMKAKKKPAP